MGPHFEAKSGRDGGSIREDVSQMGKSEAALEVPLELRLPIGVAEVDRLMMTTMILLQGMRLHHEICRRNSAAVDGNSSNVSGTAALLILRVREKLFGDPTGARKCVHWRVC